MNKLKREKKIILKLVKPGLEWVATSGIGREEGLLACCIIYFVQPQREKLKVK